MKHKYVLLTRIDSRLVQVIQMLEIAGKPHTEELEALRRTVGAEFVDLPAYLERNKSAAAHAACKAEGFKREFKSNAKKIYADDLKTVNWDLSDSDIARKFDVSRERIRQIRIEMDKPARRELIAKATAAADKALMDFPAEELSNKTRGEVGMMFPKVPAYRLNDILQQRGITLKRKPLIRNYTWEAVNWDLPNADLSKIYGLPYAHWIRHRMVGQRWFGHNHNRKSDPAYQEAWAAEVKKAEAIPGSAERIKHMQEIDQLEPKGLATWVLEIIQQHLPDQVFIKGHLTNHLPDCYRSGEGRTRLGKALIYLEQFGFLERCPAKVQKQNQSMPYRLKADKQDAKLADRQGSIPEFAVKAKKPSKPAPLSERAEKIKAKVRSTTGEFIIKDVVETLVDRHSAYNVLMRMVADGEVEKLEVRSLGKPGRGTMFWQLKAGTPHTPASEEATPPSDPGSMRSSVQRESPVDPLDQPHSPVDTGAQ